MYVLGLILLLDLFQRLTMAMLTGEFIHILPGHLHTIRAYASAKPLKEEWNLVIRSPAEHAVLSVVSFFSHCYLAFLVRISSIIPYSFAS